MVNDGGVLTQKAGEHCTQGLPLRNPSTRVNAQLGVEGDPALVVGPHNRLGDDSGARNPTGPECARRLGETAVQPVVGPRVQGSREAGQVVGGNGGRDSWDSMMGLMARSHGMVPISPKSQFAIQLEAHPLGMAA